jgi:D-xylulose reductase
MEPLAVGAHSVANLGGFRSTQSIAVFGCGPVGLLCMAVAKALGAARVIAVDIMPERLEFAKNYAATHTWLPPKPQEGESRIAYSRRNAEGMKKELGITDTGAGQVHLVIDASGAEVSIQTGCFIVASGGTFVQVRMRCKPHDLITDTDVPTGRHGRSRGHHPNCPTPCQGGQLQGFLPLRRTCVNLDFECN